jgi:acid phosphatase type 7
MLRLTLLLLFFGMGTHSFSQSVTPILDRWFFPNPGLPKNAKSPLFQDSLSLSSFQLHQIHSLQNQINQPLSGQYLFALPEEKTFSIELWLLNHVNEPIGLEVFVGEKSAFGIWDKTLETNSQKIPMKPWKSYWTHLVAVFSEGKMEIWENGKSVTTLPWDGEKEELFIQSYLEEDPYMKLDHWIKHLSLYSGKLTESAIQEKFRAHQDMRDSGLRYPNRFHFLAEPYLFPTETGMRITLETDRKASTTVRFGEEIPLKNFKQTVPITSTISTVILEDLAPGTAYFYQVISVDSLGNQLDSGVLTFKTKPAGEVPVVFGVVSDTEARPHINEQIGLQLWDERPDFVIHMGDVTDGGEKNDKWQWTQEYFPGSSALTTRIPMIPTAGNGEGDLFWYKLYHPQAEPDGFFKYSYGAGEFFVLNSNQPAQLQPGGQQYEWLKKELAQSTSAWKMVYMHHAPYSSDEDDYGNTWKGKSTHGDREFQSLVRLLEQSGVDMMFFGHLHTYMRTFPLFEEKIDPEKGIHYIQVGGMGGNLEDFAPNRVWFAEKTFRGFHYGTVSLTKEKFTLSVYRADGALIDRLEVLK